MAGERFEQDIGDLTVWKSDEGYEFMTLADHGYVSYATLDMVELRDLRTWINKVLNA